MDVSVIIVNYNTKLLTANCIDSIYEHTQGLSFEVILVDNASEDGSKDLFQNDDRIIYLYSPENLGFGKANNRGYSIAKGNYVFLLNPDTLLLNNAIKYFYDSMESLPDTIACLGTMLQDENGNKASSYGAFITLGQLFKKIGRKVFPFLKSHETIHYPFCVPVIIGADLFIRRSVIEKEGFFDPRFFMYHEENDLQRRFFLSGYRSLLIEGPKIVHLEGKSNPYKISLLNTYGRFVYIKKWEPYSTYLLYRIVFAIYQFPKLLLPKIPWEERKKYLALLLFYRA